MEIGFRNAKASTFMSIKTQHERKKEGLSFTHLKRAFKIIIIGGMFVYTLSLYLNFVRMDSKDVTWDLVLYIAFVNFFTALFWFHSLIKR